MKDNLQQYLENQCKIQLWVKNHLSKPLENKKVINKLSISSIRQKLII
jgi:hypothetical protein